MSFNVSDALSPESVCIGVGAGIVASGAIALYCKKSTNLETNSGDNLSKDIVFSTMDVLISTGFSTLCGIMSLPITIPSGLVASGIYHGLEESVSSTPLRLGAAACGVAACGLASGLALMYTMKNGTKKDK